MKSFNNLLVLKFLDVDYHEFHIKQFHKYFKSVKVFNYDYFFSKNGIVKTEEFISQLVADNHIDIVFVFLWVNNFELSIEFFKELKKKSHVVFWFFDDEVFFHSYNKFYAQIADAVITTSYYDRFAYEQLDIPAVLYFSSYSKDDYYPLNISKNIDVSFVGLTQLRPTRKKYINYLIEHGINVQTFGSDFSNGYLTLSKMVEVFSQSKINLNFTGIFQRSDLLDDNPFLPVIKQNKGRPIEIALTGSFCLSEDAPSIGKLFTINEEIDVFNSEEELLEKIDFYLSNDSVREKIALKAYKKALRVYESSVYLKSVLNDLFIKINENKNKRFKHDKLFFNTAFKKKHDSFLKTYLLMKARRKEFKKLIILSKDIIAKWGFRRFIYIIFFAKK